mmetsp:Transcript_91998/g.297643  ORF Transcript_91998/g.297643 Transcript_91998/m.297643 type:complete len:297 (-) Transcript_91998:1730-2620(-)
MHNRHPRGGRCSGCEDRQVAACRGGLQSRRGPTVQRRAALLALGRRPRLGVYAQFAGRSGLNRALLRRCWRWSHAEGSGGSQERLQLHGVVGRRQKRPWSEIPRRAARCAVCEQPHVGALQAAWRYRGRRRLMVPLATRSGSGRPSGHHLAAICRRARREVAEQGRSSLVRFGARQCWCHHRPRRCGQAMGADRMPYFAGAPWAFGTPRLRRLGIAPARAGAGDERREALLGCLAAGPWATGAGHRAAFRRGRPRGHASPLCSDPTHPRASVPTRRHGRWRRGLGRFGHGRRRRRR